MNSKTLDNIIEICKVIKEYHTKNNVYPKRTDIAEIMGAAKISYSRLCAIIATHSEYFDLTDYDGGTVGLSDIAPSVSQIMINEDRVKDSRQQKLRLEAERHEQLLEAINKIAEAIDKAAKPSSTEIKPDPVNKTVPITDTIGEQITTAVKAAEGYVKLKEPELLEPGATGKKMMKLYSLDDDLIRAAVALKWLGAMISTKVASGRTGLITLTGEWTAAIEAEKLRNVV